MIGTVVGHSVCTAGAVIAGRYVSTKIDVKYGMGAIRHCGCHRSNTPPFSDTLGSCVVHHIRVHLRLRVPRRRLLHTQPRKLNLRHSGIFRYAYCDHSFSNLHPSVAVLPAPTEGSGSRGDLCWINRLVTTSGRICGFQPLS